MTIVQTHYVRTLNDWIVGSIPTALTSVVNPFQMRARTPEYGAGFRDSIWPMSSSVQPMQQDIMLEMQRTNALFNTEVFGKRNFAAVDDIYTANARILPPGAPMISGRKAIKEFWSNLIVSANAKSAALESLEVIRTGDDAVEIGRATLTVEPEGQPQSQMEVKYVVHWQHEDGRWKWNIDIWNTNA